MLETAAPGEEGGSGVTEEGMGVDGSGKEKSSVEMQLLTGMTYNPLSGRWREVERTDVNYIASFTCQNG